MAASAMGQENVWGLQFLRTFFLSPIGCFRRFFDPWLYKKHLPSSTTLQVFSKLKSFARYSYSKSTFKDLQTPNIFKHPFYPAPKPTLPKRVIIVLRVNMTSVSQTNVQKPFQKPKYLRTLICSKKNQQKPQNTWEWVKTPYPP